MGAHDSGPGEHMKDTIDVSVRRSPRYSAFIIVGVVSAIGFRQTRALEDLN